MTLYSPKDLTALLERHNFFFKKNLGQNFLINEGVAQKIANASYETLSHKRRTLAIEIGPGAGSLTYQLAKRFDHVIALEIDPHLIPVLGESLSGFSNVEVVHTDALKYDFSQLKESFSEYETVVCSNLPYYITSELIMRLLECRLEITSMTVLIQKEAAARFSAQPNSSEYGAITAVASYYAIANKLFSVGPTNFIPRPKVDSAVLQLIPHTEKEISVISEKMFFKVIHAAFANRRKTLSNSLAGQFSDLTKDQLTTVLMQSGIDPMRRGETLNLKEFAILSNNLLNLEEY